MGNCRCYIDEALAGYCTDITVQMKKDIKITVKDNGRGIPVGIHEKMGRPAVEVIMTVLHAGGKFDGSGYSIRRSAWRRGIWVVNALSTTLDVTVYRDGKIHYQITKRGVPVGDLEIIGETDVGRTTTHFKARSRNFY
ncbi:ATP-binding protein [Bacillus sp. SL00103]